MLYHRVIKAIYLWNKWTMVYSVPTCKTPIVVFFIPDTWYKEHILLVKVIISITTRMILLMLGLCVIKMRHAVCCVRPNIMDLSSSIRLRREILCFMLRWIQLHPMLFIVSFSFPKASDLYYNTIIAIITKNLASPIFIQVNVHFHLLLHHFFVNCQCILFPGKPVHINKAHVEMNSEFV